MSGTVWGWSAAQIPSAGKAAAPALTEIFVNQDFVLLVNVNQIAVSLNAEMILSVAKVVVLVDHDMSVNLVFANLFVNLIVVASNVVESRSVGKIVALVNLV